MCHLGYRPLCSMVENYRFERTSRNSQNEYGFVRHRRCGRYGGIDG